MRSAGARSPCCRRPRGAGPATRRAGGCRQDRDRPCASYSTAEMLLVAPDVLQATPAVEGMMREEILHVRPHREVVEAPLEHGTARRPLESQLDVADEYQALGLVQLLGLLLDELRDGLVAVARVVPGGAACIVLVEVRIRIVRLESRPVGTDLELAARLQREPLGRVHRLERGVDAHLLELADDERAEIDERGKVPREHLD